MNHAKLTAVSSLYLASLAIEAATALIRLVLAGATLGLLKLAVDHPLVSVLADTLTVGVSIGPLVLSLLALAGVPGGALERFALGSFPVADTGGAGTSDIAVGAQATARRATVVRPDSAVMGDAVAPRRDARRVTGEGD